MKKWFLLFSLAISFQLFASMPIQVADDKLAEKVDHVLLAHVIGVDMVNRFGLSVTNVDAKTGPGTGRTIRLIVRIDEVFFSSSEEVPSQLKVPLDPMMHYRLGQVIEAHQGARESFLLLLSGSDFQPAFPGVFRRDLDDKEFFINMAKAKSARPD